MRTFTLGSGPDRKFVVIEVEGPRMRMIQGDADGNSKRKEKVLPSEAEARSAGEKLARELVARGFAETGGTVVKNGKPAASLSRAATPSVPRPSSTPKPSRAAEPVGALHAFEDLELVESSAPVLSRIVAEPAAVAAPKKKKSGKKKKKKGANGPGGDDALDKRVIAGIAGVGVLILGFLGFIAYDAFIKPASIVGKWVGSRLEFETGGPMSFMQYELVLDDKNKAAMTLMESETQTGTYTLKGDRLKLTLKDKDGEPTEIEYKASVGRATMDLFEPGGEGRKVVQLVRSGNKPKVGADAPPKPPKEEVAGGGAPAGGDEKIDEAADKKLASVDFSPKDGAFKMRHPSGWEVETGSRPDNLYSWARFTKGSAKIQVFADATGSLMAGANTGQHEEGSELAPVHNAHVLYKKTVAEEHSDYKESEPVLFKGARMGEGRLAAFTASGGGLFGSKLRGMRVTLLTNNRRVSVISECPEAEFDKLRPIFFAVSRSLSN